MTAAVDFLCTMVEATAVFCQGVLGKALLAALALCCLDFFDRFLSLGCSCSFCWLCQLSVVFSVAHLSTWLMAHVSHFFSSTVTLTKQP